MFNSADFHSHLLLLVFVCVDRIYVNKYLHGNRINYFRKIDYEHG